MRYLSILGVLAASILVAYANSQQGHAVGYTPAEPNVLGWVICGGVIVFIFYWIKFNDWAGDGQSPPGFRPRPVRHFTTWIRYLGWNSLYGLMMAGAYCAIVFFPDIISRFVELFAPVLKSFSLDKLFALLQSGEGTREGALQMVPYAVMLTTAVWSGMPPFSRFEERIRLRWQENASIPSQARQLMEAFEEEIEGEKNFITNDSVVAEVIRRLDNHALAESDFKDSGHNVWFLYARASYLFHMLDKHNRSPLFSSLVERYGSEFAELEKEMCCLHKLVEQRIGDILDLCEHDKVDALPGLIQEKVEQEGEIRKVPPTLKNAEQWLERYLGNASKAERAYFKGKKSSSCRR